MLYKIAAENLLILYIDKIAVRSERLRTATLKIVVLLVIQKDANEQAQVVELIPNYREHHKYCDY